jgi:hypothetical protein
MLPAGFFHVYAVFPQGIYQSRSVQESAVFFQGSTGTAGLFQSCAGFLCVATGDLRSSGCLLVIL